MMKKVAAGLQLAKQPQPQGTQRDAGKHRGKNRLRVSSFWLLLCHTVQSAESPDQIAAVDRYDFACGEKVSEGVERNAIVRIVEDRHQHRAIGDIKIGVA